MVYFNNQRRPRLSFLYKASFRILSSIRGNGAYSIHGLVLSRNYMRNLYGYSIHCFLHVAKHKTATNSQKTNEKRRRAGIPRRIVSIHQKTGVKQQSSMFCGLFFRCHFLNQHSCQFLPISYSHFNRIIPKSIASCNCNEIAA